MEDSKELYKLYTYIEGGDEILNYEDLHVLINSDEYKYNYKNADIFCDKDELILISLDDKVLEEPLVSLDEVEDLSDLERVKEIYRVRSKMDSYNNLNIDFVDNIKRANARPNYVNEPKVVREPNSDDLPTVIDYFKEHFAKGLIPLFILLFLFLASFIYYNEGDVNKIVTRVAGYTTLIYFISYIVIFTYCYIRNDKKLMNNLKKDYNEYLQKNKEYNNYLKEYDNFKRENDRIEETKKRLKIRVPREINNLESNLILNLITLTNGYIDDDKWSPSDYYKLVKIMEDERIDNLSDAIERWNQLYASNEKSNKSKTDELEAYDDVCEYDEECDDDYEDDEETEKYIRSGELIRNTEEESEIVELLKKQNELLARQHYEETMRLRKETQLKAREEARRLQEEKKLQNDIRYQCNTCANRANCATINKTPNCQRYEWKRLRKY